MRKNNQLKSQKEKTRKVLCLSAADRLSSRSFNGNFNDLFHIEGVYLHFQKIKKLHILLTLSP